MAAGNQTGTETQAEHKPGFPPFESEQFPSQLLWLAITFGAIYLFVSKVFIKRVGGTIAERAGRIARDLDAAAAAKVRADEATAAHAKAVEQAREKAQGIARETRDAMNATSETRRKAVEADLAAKLAGADKEIAARKLAAMANVHAIAQETAAAIVARLTGQPASPAELSTALSTAHKS
ncbi:MAG: F0F1 ATP synthase subunit B' [Hyphomicrobiales bacterium]|nr:F0F1 ATP synthase subunit B' [Hyphomicrobiales bacterium]MBV9431105.1 F0F1 ATP synthase subunit B' [Hyphomicrobiales bacterium]